MVVSMKRLLAARLVAILTLGACRGSDTAPPPRSGSAPLGSIAAPPSNTSASSTPTTASEAATTTYVPAGVNPTGSCLARAQFGAPAESPYVLPFPPGARYQISQSYCFEDGGHRDQLAYDFIMPIGEDVVAMRRGEVKRVVERWPDEGGGPGEHNLVLILHEDGTVAFYAHLEENGVDVEVGDVVAAGDRIAASGWSGQVASAHLHVQVFATWPISDGDDVAFNFSNADGPLDPRGGLKAASVYTALPSG